MNQGKHIKTVSNQTRIYVHPAHGVYVNLDDLKKLIAAIMKVASDQGHTRVQGLRAFVAYILTVSAGLQPRMPGLVTAETFKALTSKSIAIPEQGQG